MAILIGASTNNTVSLQRINIRVTILLDAFYSVSAFAFICVGVRGHLFFWNFPPNSFKEQTNTIRLQQQLHLQKYIKFFGHSICHPTHLSGRMYFLHKIFLHCYFKI